MNFRNFVVFILIFGFALSLGISQNKDIFIGEENNNEKWIKAIDYLSAKLTYEYILEFDSNNKLTAEEKESFDSFREQLANNTIDKPISPSKLKSFTEDEFQKTYKKLSERIYSLKNIQKKSAVNLFKKSDSILTLVESTLVNSTVYDSIRSDVYSNLQNENIVTEGNIQTINDRYENEVLNEASLLPEWFFKALSGLLLLTSIICYTAYKHNRNRARELNNEIEELKKNGNSNSQLNQNRGKEWLKETRKSIKNNFPNPSSGKKQPDSTFYQKNKINQSIPTENKSIDDNEKFTQQHSILEKSEEVRKTSSKSHLPDEMKVINDQVPNNILYAGKPTNDGWFKDAEKLKGDNHIYELKLSNESEAEFSLLELSNYMETEVINSPDEYLYRVCINENSNQEYRNEIITTKKGIAHNVDGKWKVNDENKATIKFQ